MIEDQIVAIIRELERIGATRLQVGDAAAIGVFDDGRGKARLVGSLVKGRFNWFGEAKDILERLKGLPDDSGPEAIRSEFSGLGQEWAT